MRIGLSPFLALCLSTAAVPAQNPPRLLPNETVAALAGEVSGESAHRTVEQLAQWHRMRGSQGFRSAASFIAERLRQAGLREVEIWEFPADGEIFYGTQRSRPAWDAEFAELWELEQRDGQWTRSRRIASWQDRPISLAQDSSAGRVEHAELVDVGTGTDAADYQGKPVQGRLILTSSQPGAVSALALEHGAVGIVSYAQNQHTAWWRLDEDLVRWGHLNTFPEPTTFAFMVSLKQARSWKERLERGESVVLGAEVRAGQHPGSYSIATATIPGTDPQRRGEQIVFSCHLDHQRPGANDNASGCAAILEAARTLAKLVREGRIDPPRRTLRFVWPPEIEGSLALLNGRPGFADRTKAVIHLDMVGGGPVTKAVFHVTRSPKSLPTFVNDVAEEFTRFVNRQSELFADTGSAAYPFWAPEGGREPLRAEFVDFTPGSDHEVYAEGGFRIPAIYMNDWPDRYIHTHGDVPANIDSTKLLRAAFIAAASGYCLAMFEGSEADPLLDVLQRDAFERAAAVLRRMDAVPEGERRNLARFQVAYEEELLDSISRFERIPALAPRVSIFLLRLKAVLGADSRRAPAADEPPEAAIVYRRVGPKGPLSVFGYDYLEDHLEKMGLPAPGLASAQGLWGSDYEYEALNLVDGERSVREIRDDLSAIYGPVSLELVAEYLATLEKIGMLARQ